MATNSPAPQRDRSAPFSQTFTTSQASLVNKIAIPAATGQPLVAPYLNPCSGLVLIPLTAAAFRVDWTDCAGTVNSIAFTATAENVGIAIPLPVGAIALPVVTNAAVVVYWHGNGSYN